MALSLLCLLLASVYAWASPANNTNSTSTVGASFPSLIDATLGDLRWGLEKGCFTSTDLVKAYLARIDQVNGKLHAVTEVNPDALDIAASLDKERATNVLRGPLHGIPILIKNTIATMDRMNNTAGSYALIGATVPRDSAIAKKLREAGAIILGKTNMSQWGHFRDYNMSVGWSAHGGQVTAAYHQEQNPGGSSSGSGVAVDLGLAFAALGTETIGSMLFPAHRNGIVAIKPTVGLTSRDLVIPISEHQDTVGPMARTVRDAAHILQAIAGQDSRDNYTSAIPCTIPDYVAACDERGLSGARIGVPWNVVELMNDDNPVDMEVEAFQKALTILEDAGATLVESNFTMAREFLDANPRIVLEADFVVNLAAYLSELNGNPSGVGTLADVRQWTRNSPAEGYPSPDTSVWDEVLDVLRINNTDPLFWASYQKLQRLSGPGGLFGALDRHGLAAVALPTSMSPNWAAVVGAPMVTVPMGHYPATAPVQWNHQGNLVDTGPGVPFGLSFMGRRWAEAELITLAYAFEQRTRVRGRVRPLVVPDVEVVSSYASG